MVMNDLHKLLSEITTLAQEEGPASAKALDMFTKNQQSILKLFSSSDMPSNTPENPDRNLHYADIIVRHLFTLMYAMGLSEDSSGEIVCRIEQGHTPEITLHSPNTQIVLVDDIAPSRDYDEDIREIYSEVEHIWASYSDNSDFVTCVLNGIQQRFASMQAISFRLIEG